MSQRLRILIVGASGVLGNAIVAELSPRHEESIANCGPFFRGFDPAPVAPAARAFSRSAEGLETGKSGLVV